jgi:hypothetical protein
LQVWPVGVIAAQLEHVDPQWLLSCVTQLPPQSAIPLGHDDIAHLPL